MVLQEQIFFGKSPIPKHGYNSPVIWGDKIFISGADNTTREVYCYNRN